MKPRILERDVAEILRLISDLPNQRPAALPGDLAGEFDLWFDGGAVKYVTGSTKYYFANGTKAWVAVLMGLNVGIVFPDGRQVSIQQNL